MKLRVAGAELACEVSGAGPAVLLLHAFPLGLAMWEPQAAALADAHQVVRFDCRGFGGSPPGDGLLTMERIADDASAILDRLGIPSAAVVGISMGGYAAFALVRRHPERIRALVLADTRAGADSPETKATRAAQAEQVRREGTRAIADAALPRLLGVTSHRERPELVARVRRIIEANPPRGITDALAGLAARADSTPTLREIRVPTLVVVGEEDAITPEAEAETLGRGIAGSRRAVVPRAGHLSSLENPEEFNRPVRSFLAGLG
ncbi:MAG TPA: alpha/beta fold hydrolase [Vicinamibacteria bacterium]